MTTSVVLISIRSLQNKRLETTLGKQRPVPFPDQIIELELVITVKNGLWQRGRFSLQILFHMVGY